MDRIELISVEGIIGSGKSTVISRLKSDGLCAFEEPVQDWTLLEDYYRQPTKYGSPLQFQILLSYHKIFQTIKSYGPGSVVYMERGPWAIKNIFNPEIALPNEVTTVINNIHETLNFPEPDLFIYLKVDPATAYRRTIRRGRNSERTITLDYFEALYRKYETTIYDPTKNHETHVITVDASQDPDTLYNEIKTQLKDLSGF